MRFEWRLGSGGWWTSKVGAGLHALLQLRSIAAPRLARMLHWLQPAAAQQMPHLLLPLLQSPVRRFTTRVPAASVGNRHRLQLTSQVPDFLYLTLRVSRPGRCCCFKSAKSLLCGGRAVHCGMLSSIPGLCSPNTSGAPHRSVTSQTLSRCLLGGKVTPGWEPLPSHPTLLPNWWLEAYSNVRPTTHRGLCQLAETAPPAPTVTQSLALRSAMVPLRAALHVPSPFLL